MVEIFDDDVTLFKKFAVAYNTSVAVSCPKYDMFAPRIGGPSHDGEYILLPFVVARSSKALNFDRIMRYYSYRRCDCML